ncbi:Ankyrin repeat family A protein 2 (RFXANK-like protein 2), partial [Durusdinium trenchii]
PQARTYLESRGDPNVYDSSTGWTPLLMAVSSGHTQLVDLLLQCKADPAKGAKSTGETAVHLAVYRTSGEVLQQLLNFRRQCVQDVRQDGSTALMLALERSPPKVKIEYVRSLLEKNADPNVKRKDGWSALGLAIRANMRPATKMMIAVEGKVLSTVPGSQLTLWELAEQHKDLQKLIKSKLSSKNLAEIEKRWPGTLLRMQIAD